MYRLHTSLFPSGERFPVILYEESLQPLTLPTRYIIDERRDTRKSGTIERDLRVIKWLYIWACKREIDLDSRLRSGELLTVGEITGLCRHLRTRRSDIIVGGINLKGEEQFDILSPKTFNTYLSVVEAFLHWAAHTFIPSAAPTKETRKRIEEAKKTIRGAFRGMRVGGCNAPKSGLSLEEVAALREVLQPGSKQNPFKKSVQLRNYVINELLLATGIRRGEVLVIKLNHLPRGQKTTLTIERAPDDQADPRRNEPQVKTRGREIPIPQRLAKLLWEYVQKHRKKGNHPFLFTSNRGGVPLDLGGVNWIYSLLVKKCFPHLDGRLSPHVIRYTFNERVVATGDSLGWKEDDLGKAQKYLCGWKEDSHMPELYARQAIAAKAALLMEQYQKSLWED